MFISTQLYYRWRSVTLLTAFLSTSDWNNALVSLIKIYGSYVRRIKKRKEREMAFTQLFKMNFEWQVRLNCFENVIVVSLLLATHEVLSLFFWPTHFIGDMSILKEDNTHFQNKFLRAPSILKLETNVKKTNDNIRYTYTNLHTLHTKVHSWFRWKTWISFVQWSSFMEFVGIFSTRFMLNTESTTKCNWHVPRPFC